MGTSLPMTGVFAALMLVATSLSLFGCATSGPDVVETRAGLGCVDDSSACIAHRQAALRNMVDDKSRSWVKESPTPEAYASGVRLFAFKTKKKELSCDELARGKLEADTARTSLYSATGRLTHAQITRGAMLATEVGRELQIEMGKRCKKG